MALAVNWLFPIGICALAVFARTFSPRDFQPMILPYWIFSIDLTVSLVPRGEIRIYRNVEECESEWNRIGFSEHRVLEMCAEKPFGQPFILLAPFRILHWYKEALL